MPAALVRRVSCTTAANTGWWPCRSSVWYVKLETPFHNKGGVVCKALAGAASVYGQKICRHKRACTGIAGAYGVGLWLTMLPDAGSRGRFCADLSVGAVSVGPEAGGRGIGARVSGLHLHAK
eukprot:scaffold6185_cov132-Isochrysis_galbana.AAC.3